MGLRREEIFRRSDIVVVAEKRDVEYQGITVAFSKISPLRFFGTVNKPPKHLDDLQRL